MVCRWRFLPSCRSCRGYCSNSSRPATLQMSRGAFNLSVRAEKQRAHIQKKRLSVSLSHRDRPNVGRHTLRKKTFRNEWQLTETVRTDGRTRVRVCGSSAHLRNVCRGHSLKAPPTDNVYADIKASFRSTDEARLLTQRACVRACT